MTTVNAFKGEWSVRAPGLEGDAGQLRQNLLHSLERQWLDSWGQAAQDQEAEAKTVEARASVGGAEPTARDVLGPQGGQATLRARTQAQARSNVQRSPGEQMERSAPARAAQGLAGRMERTGEADTPGRAATAAAPNTPCLADLGADALLAHGGASNLFGVGADVHAWMRQDLDRNRPGDGLDALCAASPASCSEASIAAGSQEALLAAPLSVNYVTATSEARARLAGRAQSQVVPPRAHAGAAAEAEAASGGERLSLRELGDDEVLASLRDAQLGASGSRRAAHELAHALMQAGYARVQVYVNGNAVQREAAGSASAPAADAPDQCTATFEAPMNDDPMKELPHGH